MTTPTATIFMPYHALDDVIMRGLRADQPDAADVVPGTLYCVLDEGNQLERSSGSAWELMGATGTGGIPGPPGPQGEPGASTSVFFYRADAVSQSVSDPGAGRIRWNQVPQTTATTLVFDWLTDDDFDVHLLFQLMQAPARFLLQDADLATTYQLWEMTAPATNMPDWFYVPAVFVSGSGPAFANNARVALLVMAQGAPGPVGPSGPVGPPGPATARGSTIGIVIDGAGAVITPGVKGYFEVGVPCTITAATLLSSDAAATPGSLVVDIWKDTFAHYPPVAADTICAAARPTLVSASQSRDTALTGWTKAIQQGDILAFSVVSAAVLTKATLTLSVLLGSNFGTVAVVLDGRGVPIASGLQGFYEVGMACTITAVSVLSTDPAVTPGSIVVDIWKAPYASYPPTVANSITGSAPPSLVAAVKSEDTTLVGWTTAIAAGDVLAFHVVSATSVTRVSVALTVLLG